jgi:hypothetical protein
MTTTPRRAWFQIHLSTAVVMMIVATALLWLNTRTITIEPEKPNTFESDLEAFRNFFQKAPKHGWPFVAYEVPVGVKYDGNAMRPMPTDKNVIWYGKGIAANLAIVLLLLIISASIMEFFLRRREARTP